MKKQPVKLMSVALFEDLVHEHFPEAAVERNDATGELVIYTGWVQEDPHNQRKRLRWGRFLDEYR